MTETNMITSNPYDGERRPGAVGFALPGVSVRIADFESGAPVQAGEIGVIEVKGPNVFAGYWRMPEKTSQEFRADGHFITGDLANVDDDGYIHIVGRAKDLVISGGFNVYPKEVETEIDAIEGVLESAVFGVPHADLGEAVTAVVVARPGATLSTSAILSALGHRLAKFKAPKQIVVVDSLPRNAMGKVQEGGAAGGLQGHISQRLSEWRAHRARLQRPRKKSLSCPLAPARQRRPQIGRWRMWVEPRSSLRAKRSNPGIVERPLHLLDRRVPPGQDQGDAAMTILRIPAPRYPNFPEACARIV